MQERVVITGMGAVSPLGLSSEESWQNAINGISGVGPITLFDPSDFLVNLKRNGIDFFLQGLMMLHQVFRGKRLVGKAHIHDARGMALCSSEIH